VICFPVFFLPSIKRFVKGYRPLIYFEFICVQVFFGKQPQHLRKIYSCWSSLADNPNLTLEDVRSTIIPLLKGNKLLEESFIELLPGAMPPER